MRTIWSTRASQHLASIYNDIFYGGPAVAAAQVERILKAVGTLPRFPAQGRPGRAPNTRELVVGRTPYILAYKIKQTEKIVEIVAILHGARRWPEHL